MRECLRYPPLAAFMQDRSPPDRRGSILAASNFLTFGGMFLASIGYWLLRRPHEGNADDEKSWNGLHTTVARLATDASGRAG